MSEIEDKKSEAEKSSTTSEGAPEDAPKLEAKVDELEAKAAAADTDEDDGEEDAAQGDSASPEAIAKRVAAFGEEDESDKIARAEEQKLLARKASSKKGKKGGLAKSASKKLEGIGVRAQPKREVAIAVEAADPLMARMQKVGEWAKNSQRTVAILIGLVVVAGGVAFLSVYFDHKKELDASVELAQAVDDERGRLGDPAKEDDEHGPKDPRPVFKTAEDRRDAALAKFKEVDSKFPKTGAAILSRLSEGSIFLDKRDADAAAGAFGDVKSSPLAAVDAEVRGRAFEGLGFAYELKAEQNKQDSAKYFDQALAVYKEMESSVDVKGFKELAMYHQARVLEAKGDNDGAKALLVTVRDRVTKPGENHPFPYLEEVALDRLRELDPTLVPAKQAQGPMGRGAGGPKMNDAQIQQLLERLKKQQQQAPEKK